MAGRKRRASTSSVDSVDESQIHWRQEVSVVRSVAKDAPSDDWPIFELRDAVVLNRDGQTLENALHVALRGPYMVRGHLIIDDPAQRSYLISRVRKSCPLEIRHSTTFAFGESDDGSPLIWVSGRGGWYEINPSPAYRQIYRKMCEATTLYYNMVDIYNSPKRPKKTKKTKHWALLDQLTGVFLQYAARVGDGSTLDEVIARCREHAAFLINQFLHLNTHIDWKPTAFYRWITTENAELVEKIDHVMKNPQIFRAISVEELTPAPRESTSTPPAKSASVEEVDGRKARLEQRLRASSSLAPPPAQLTKTRTAAQTTREPSKPDAAPASSSGPVPKSAKQTPKPLEPPAPADRPPSTSIQTDEPGLASVLEAMESTYDALIGSRKGVIESTVLNKLYFDYQFPAYRDSTVGSHKKPVQELLHYYATPLLQRFSKAKDESPEFYCWLEKLSRIEFEPMVYKMSDFPVTLHPRKRKPRNLKKEVPQQQPSTPPPVPAADTMEQDDDDDVDENDGQTTAARRGKSVKRHGRRKKSYLRPVAANKKRSHSQIDSDSESNGSESAPARNSHYFSDDGDDVMEDAPASDAGDDDNDETSAEPLTVVIRAERIPDATPKGPDETWICDQDGCSFIVRARDDVEGQERIRAHLSEHAQQLERVSLAVTESRGHMPINHLLEKIKRMGKKSLPRHQDTTPLPAPIKRKLIV
ncbi:hypothetical protein XA68_12833 [Ophiocordyceps unilateralis]|uniref:DNA (cytosine-5)-methyltransferase 1 replication foci domain-containing protein n=1 Tax=Ophiocordyceps unilateralis TaxID=268505 RepID=A0A2A9PCP7_OPHUN|nr:hypothetical protein XA68_12833 [Ophiocordyceps unilateralis]